VIFENYFKHHEIYSESLRNMFRGPRVAGALNIVYSTIQYTYNTYMIAIISLENKTLKFFFYVVSCTILKTNLGGTVYEWILYQYYPRAL